jgi:hypothetical protein
MSGIQYFSSVKCKFPVQKIKPRVFYDNRFLFLNDYLFVISACTRHIRQPRFAVFWGTVFNTVTRFFDVWSFIIMSDDTEIWRHREDCVTCWLSEHSLVKSLRRSSCRSCSEPLFLPLSDHLPLALGRNTWPFLSVYLGVPMTLSLKAFHIAIVASVASSASRAVIIVEDAQRFFRLRKEWDLEGTYKWGHLFDVTYSSLDSVFVMRESGLSADTRSFRTATPQPKTKQ